MIIALDYDGTYTKDQILWDNFIRICKDRKHTVYCVTMRYPDENLEIENTIGKSCKIIYTSRKAKIKFLESIGIFPDVWIDDQPYFILADAAY